MDEDALPAFGTDGWRAPVTDMTGPKLRSVGRAAATYLDRTDAEGPVAVGYDARESSPDFAVKLGDALAAAGRDVVLPTRDCPTPSLAWEVTTGEFALGLMVTASHNPPTDNGVKVITSEGAPAPPAVTEAIEALLGSTQTTAGGRGTVSERDWIDPYVDHVVEFGGQIAAGSTNAADRNGSASADTAAALLDGTIVAYDAMHGSGRGVTDAVLARSGAELQRLRCERVPDFGGQPPEPTPETAEDLVERVVVGNADLGVINDGDADRVGIVTPEHRYVDPNVLLAVIYEFLLQTVAGDVVRTVSTSSLVDRIADAHGHAVHETPVGFKWVAEAMLESDAVFGGEESGGFGVARHLPNKDGVLVALLACLAHAERPLDERIDSILDEYGEIHQSRRSLDCPDEAKGAVMEAIGSAFDDSLAGVTIESVSTADGVKAHLTDGSWLLIRPSGTEPKLRVYAEATSESRVEELLSAGEDLVGPIIARQ